MKARVIRVVLAALMIMSIAALVSCDFFTGFWDPLAMKSYYLYAACYSSDSVWAYEIDARTGALTKIGDYRQANASCLAVDPAGKFVYVTNAWAPSKLWAYTINADTGALTPVSDSPLAAGTDSSSVTGDPTGRFVYVATGGSKVVAYTIDAGTGTPTPMADSPFETGMAPSGIATVKIGH